MTGVTDARHYARIRYRLLVVGMVGGLIFLWAYQGLGLSLRSAQWVRGWATGEPVRLCGYLAIFGVCYYLAFLPLHFYRDFVLEHRFDLSRLTLGGWLVRETKQVLLGAVLGLLLMEGLYALFRHVPTHWPLWAAGGWVGVNVILARVFPTVLLPIFYRTIALKDEAPPAPPPQ